MVFEYFVRTLIGLYYSRFTNWIARVNWQSFGSTDTYRSADVLYEPTDGEAISP